MIATDLWRQAAETLSAFGIEAEAMHHEVAKGQYEMDLRYANSLKTADDAVTFRVVMKRLAQQKGLYAKELCSTGFAPRLQSSELASGRVVGFSHCRAI